jgi:predicted MFS family arabinose efflux permease
MVSSVVDAKKRGSFMSFNSSVQQLGTGAASLAAGFIVLNGEGGKILRYPWLGYLSIVILLCCALIGFKIFRTREGTEKQAEALSTESV